MKVETRKKAAIWLFGLGMFCPLFNILSASLLKELCSPAMRLFFKRYWIGTVGVWIVGYVAIGIAMLLIRSQMIMASGLAMGMLIKSLLSLFIVWFLMNGSELITRYYQLDDMTASKVRLLQTGILVLPLLVLLPGWGIFLTYLLMFLGVRGIIRSGLLAEGRSGEDCGVVTVARWSRPAVAALCFYGCMLVFGGIIFILEEI